MMTVDVKDEKMRKPYLGGWRHRVTGLIYLNAASQTGPFTKSNAEKTQTRGVQSTNIRDTSNQSNRDVATQMCRPDCYIPCHNDKYMTVGSYESFEAMQKRIDYNGKARIIQKCYRSWKMLKNIKECTEEYRRIVSDCRKFENERDDQHRKRHHTEIFRQLEPKKRSDFDKIYSLIEGWRNSRLNLIKQNFFKASSNTEYCQVLDKTVEMLKSVEKHRRSILLRHREKKFLNFLNFHCKPVKWNRDDNGEKIEMITMRNQRAREYKILYDSLCRNHVKLEERMEILILLKRTIEPHNCKAAYELKDLIEQEILLSSRQIEKLSLGNLRRRISLSFLCFIRQCHNCCYDDDRSMELELDEPDEGEKLLCQCCMRILPCTRFLVHVRMKKLSCCLGCHWLRQHTVEKVDYDPYTYLLNGIRADEQRRKCFSSLLYVIQEPGIYHLVCNIWHGRSIVSEVDDIFRLRLVRYNVQEEWSPWNCILLTEEEADAHYYIEDLTTVYSKVLLDRIQLAHEMAKTHFEELVKFERKFRKSDRYQLIQNS